MTEVIKNMASSSSACAPPPPSPPPAPPPPPPSVSLPAPLSSTIIASVPPPPILHQPPPPPHHPLPPAFSTFPRTDLPHHRLYDFAKTALIKIFVSPYATVCDLYCGGGADIDKWDEAQIGHYIGIDASSFGISEAREMWESQRKPYTAEFCELDPSITENLELHFQEKGVPADIVCCLQHLQLCFENEEKATRLLLNVSHLLKPGGYFFGITPDSSTIWAKYQKNVEASHNKGGSVKPYSVVNCIRSENYVITFESEEEKFPFFGKQYQLKFSNDIVSEVHSLVHFPSLIRLAREAGLEYVEIQNLTEFYDDYRAQFASMLLGYGANFVDSRGKLLPRAFDILGLYAAFVFQKTDLDVVPPISTAVDGGHPNDEEWSGSGRRQQTFVGVVEKNGHTEISVSQNSCALVENEKGILGPGPAELRFPDPL